MTFVPAAMCVGVSVMSLFISQTHHSAKVGVCFSDDRYLKAGQPEEGLV